MKKKIIIVSSMLLPIIIIFIPILVACLIVLDFFGVNTTDGYVVDNMAYAQDYKNVLNENIQNGYVPLERILYFYLANPSLSFSKIYQDNLDLSSNRMKPITEVCSQIDYARLSVCNTFEIKLSKQTDEYQSKPFGKPIDFDITTITSFFMQQRIVFDKYDVHPGWDLAADANIIEKRGAWYSYKGEKLAQGRENVKLLFKNNLDFRNEIEELVREHYGIARNKDKQKKETDEEN